MAKAGAVTHFRKRVDAVLKLINGYDLPLPDRIENVGAEGPDIIWYVGRGNGHTYTKLVDAFAREWDLPDSTDVMAGSDGTTLHGWKHPDGWAWIERPS